MISWADIETHIEQASHHADAGSKTDIMEDAAIHAQLAQAHATVALAAHAWRADGR